MVGVPEPRDAWPSGPPSAVLFDAGMTLIHPSGEVLLEELAAHGVYPMLDAPTATCALVLAAEARHLPLPADLDGTERVALTWGHLLGLERSALPACVAAVSRPDLYRDADPDAHATLGALAELGMTLGVVSNSAGTVRSDLADFGMLGYFDVVIDSTVVGVEKPAPGIFWQAVAELDCPADECWHVGDGLVNDVLAARAAGLGAAVLYDRFESFAHLPDIARVTGLFDVVDVVSARLMRRDRHHQRAREDR